MAESPPFGCCATRRGRGEALIGNDTLAVSCDARSRRLINNFVLNYVGDPWTHEDRQGNLFDVEQRSQLSLYYGSKYVFDTYDGQDYSGYTDIIGAEYRFDLAEHMPNADLPGSMRLSAKMFYTDTYESRLQPGAPLNDAVGEISVPEFRGNFAIGYSNGPLDLDLQGIWTSAVVADNLATIENLPYEVNNIDDYWRFNGTIGYRINDRVRAQLAISNLFDVEVPFAAQVFHSFGTYDPIGRTYLLRLTANF